MLASAAVHGTTIPVRSGGARRRFAAAVLAACTALVLAGCSGQTGNARVDTVDAGGDGTLRIGLILDNTGKQSFLNSSQLAAAKLAVEEINAAGGHKGRPVELLPEKISEDTTAQAKELVAAKADVVIGPTDSSRAPGAIDVLARAKVAVISPANAAHGLSRYRSGGYYFRTSAADVAQAPVLVKLAKDGGARTIAVLHEEGSYGKDVSVAVAAAAEDGRPRHRRRCRIHAWPGTTGGGGRQGRRTGRRHPGGAHRRPGRNCRTQQQRPGRQQAHPQRRRHQPVRLRPRVQCPRRRPRDPSGRLPLGALPGRARGG